MLPSAPTKLLSKEQILSYARAAGFPEAVAIVMTAIALRESAGDPHAYNGNKATGDQSYGLWQINMIGPLGVARKKQFGIESYNELFDPIVSARAAFLTWGGDNRNLKIAWYIDQPKYKEAYEKFLPEVLLAALFPTVA